MFRFNNLIFVALMALVLGISDTTSAQAVTIPITLPVDGSFIFNGKLADGSLGSQLLSLNTFTGEIQSLQHYEDAIDSLVWDAEGSQVAYLDFPASVTIFDVLSGQASHSIISDAETTFFRPQSWSLDGNEILYRATQLDLQQPDSAIYTLLIMDVPTASVSTLLTIEAGQVLDDIPLPPMPEEVTQLVSRGIEQVAWNPVYPEWMVVQLIGYTSEITLADMGEGTEFDPTILFNQQTGDMISLDQFVGEPIDTTPIQWSSDGERLFVSTYKDINLIGVDFSAEVPELTLLGKANTEDIVILDWLGAGDLLLGGITENVTMNHIYYIGQVINDTWYKTEFFRLPADSFLWVGTRDWYMRASEAEKQSLVSLFEQK